MEIKKFNPGERATPLAGDTEEGKAFNNSSPDNLTMEDEEENDGDESAVGAEAEGGKPYSNALSGEDGLDGDEGDDASDQLTGEDELDEDEGDDASDQLTGDDELDEDEGDDASDQLTGDDKK